MSLTREIEDRWLWGFDIRPSAAHIDAWERASAKIEGRAPFLYLPRHVLPPIQLRWDDGGLPATAAAETSLFRGGVVVVVLRSTRPPDAVHADALHELQHVLDRSLIGCLSPAMLEWRADATAERLARL